MAITSGARATEMPRRTAAPLPVFSGCWTNTTWGNGRRRRAPRMHGVVTRSVVDDDDLGRLGSHGVQYWGKSFETRGESSRLVIGRDD